VPQPICSAEPGLQKSGRYDRCSLVRLSMHCSHSSSGRAAGAPIIRGPRPKPWLGPSRYRGICLFPFNLLGFHAPPGRTVAPFVCPFLCPCSDRSPPSPSRCKSVPYCHGLRPYCLPVPISSFLTDKGAVQSRNEAGNDFFLLPTAAVEGPLVKAPGRGQGPSTTRSGRSPRARRQNVLPL